MVSSIKYPSRFHPVHGLLWTIVMVGAGCSGPSATTLPSPEEPVVAAPAPAGPPFTVLYADADGLVLRNLRTGTTARLLPGARYIGPSASSPDGSMLAFAYARGDSTALGVLDLSTHALWTAHVAPGTVVYTLAWAPDGRRFAFGNYTPRDEQGQPAMGEGGVQVATPAARAVRDVGCTAARAAVHWLPEGDLVVRDDATLYVVDATDCRPLHRLDARRMHHVTYAADGQWMAYVYRDLVFNRATRQYEPDSTLFVADVRGENPRKVRGYEARPRHLAWSPRGAELAFDARDPEHGNRRLVLIFDADQDRAYYLVNPAEEGGFDDARPRWSPSADRLAFDRRYSDAGIPMKVVRTFAEPFVRVLTETSAVTAGWAGEEALLLYDPAVGYALLPVEDPTPLPLSGADAVVYVTPLQ